MTNATGPFGLPRPFAKPQRDPRGSPPDDPRRPDIAALVWNVSFVHETELSGGDLEQAARREVDASTPIVDFIEFRDGTYQAAFLAPKGSLREANIERMVDGLNDALESEDNRVSTWAIGVEDTR